MAIDETFDERFDALAAIAFRVAFRLTGSRGDAEDIAQESLARTVLRWKRVVSYDEAFVTRVATNLALGTLRRRQPPLDIPPQTRDASQTVADRRTLVDLVRRLPRRQREVVTLRFLADLPERRIAELLGCSIGSVKQHTSRALAALRADLDNATPVPPPGGTTDARTSR